MSFWQKIFGNKTNAEPAAMADTAPVAQTPEQNLEPEVQVMETEKAPEVQATEPVMSQEPAPEAAPEVQAPVAQPEDSAGGKSW